MHPTRRRFLYASGATVLALPFLGNRSLAQKGGFTLPKLPYPFDALEPHIDAKTMEIHHNRHHQTYVTNLNKALTSAAPGLLDKPMEDILRHVEKVPERIRQAVINNGGGHANHTLFWEIMGPKGGGKPSGALGKAIDSAFGSFDKFQNELSQAAINRFGSGWGWLVLDKGKLSVISTANQDSPLMKGQTPILGVDVWEHAYYLKYQNRRADYVKAWWNVINWDAVSERYGKAQKP